MAAGDVFVGIDKLKIRDCAKFNGINANITLAALNGVNIPEYSITAWVKFRSLSNTQTILYVHDRIYLLTTGGNLESKVFNADWIGSTTPDTIIELNKWHHIAATFTGTTMCLYVDSVLSNRETIALTNITLTNTGRIGSWNGDALKWFDGDIADLTLHDRAISAKEISKLYSGYNINETAEIKLTFSDSADLENDTSGNNRDGVNVNCVGTPMLSPRRVTANDKYGFVPLSNGQEIMCIHIEE